ncbi:alpha/beta-hydrolase [Laetiporus sulphureus 93-53]|uniref:Alpha/beta-hydrolase n=1 Tax=Laetiporus sulphureus 93-53 TaxID=1314785 RepID=A0A165BKH5_9APHY|nr:alpha/beta-hydrolase [Laetiporus sulphureus 93-53]KZT01221.1 alpha/beta-hydrolase [Laetiporus sulphureus 93-53]
MDTYLASLPVGVKSNVLLVNDLNMHILEAGMPSSPLIILIHGFPELAFSWRKLIMPISQLGYHVVAPDNRGFGRTTSQVGPDRQVRFEDDVNPYRKINIVRDVIALTFALGHRTVAGVIGHDLGAHIAALCVLIRPDVFRSVVLMSMPFQGPPTLPFTTDSVNLSETFPSIFSADRREQLAKLDPPRKYYIPYFAGPDAAYDMSNAPQGIHAFLRAYFHMKSADWRHNDPHPLASEEPSELAKLPHYYMMPLASTMPEAVAPHAPNADEIARNRWLTDDELAVYAKEYKRTGFQGGLNWYRSFRPEFYDELGVFAGKVVEVPATFISGKQDWGMYQTPGALEKMMSEACSKMREEDVIMVDEAGHWIQQEQPEKVMALLERFLSEVKASE